MPTSRRTFLKGLGATTVALYSTDLVAELLAQSPKGAVLQSKFKGLADIVLGEAKRLGCSYADVRFTMTVPIPGGNASFNANGAGGDAGGGGFGGGGGGR